MRALAVALLALALAPAAAAKPHVLLFTKTAAFRHDSIPAAVQALSARPDFAADHTEDAGAFTDANLARYDVVVFLMTTGDVLDAAQQAAMERFVRSGGGFVGVHSAADTEYGWPWYGQLLGTWFKTHPAVQQATLDVVDPSSPATAGLPRQWTRTDEWYAFRTQPQGVHVLLTIDESTYQPGDAAMGASHPIAWEHDFDGGRAFYTALGHIPASYSDQNFLHHIYGGIYWAATGKGFKAE